MTALQIFGFPQSTYTRVVLMAAKEKGIDVEHIPVPPHSDEVNAIHPLGKIPVMRHGDVAVAESRAILEYMERTFDGAELIPEEPVARAKVEQWVSIINTAVDGCLIRNYLFAYLFPKGPDGQPDRAAIDAATEEMKKHIAYLDEAVSDSSYLAGETLTIADLNLAPILFYIKKMPEGAAALAAAPNLSAYYDRLAERASFKETIPPPPGN